MLKRLIRQLAGSGRSVDTAARATLPEAEITLSQALALMRARDYAAATQICQDLIARDAAAPGPWELLGAIALERGEKELACERFETALSLAGEQPTPLCNAAEANRQAGQLNRALELSARALALDPDNGPAMYNQALTLQSCWRTDEALAVYRRLLALRPDLSQAYAGYLFLLALLGEDPLLLRSEHCRWAEINAEPLRASAAGHPNACDPLRQLRIGYVSADFRDHAASSFLEPILAAHDRAGFETYCYSSTEATDTVTDRLRATVSCWRDVRWQDDAALATLIRADRIDILVDLSGHTNGNRLAAFARKPAPVQVTYLGYPATTGMSAMDYRISDARLDPPGAADGYYTEKLLRLPHSLWCFRPPASMPEPGPLPALQSRQITFGSLNSMLKITPAMIALWSRLLLSIPRSRLIVATVGAGQARERIAAEFARQGVPSEVLFFRAPLAREQFWALSGEIDIALDSHPCNGGATTCETLWMGLPVVSLAGELFQSRAGLSLLSVIGLPQLIARSESDYLRIARELASDLEQLSQLRQGLRARMRASPLLDEKGFTRSLESLYREAWRDWCERAPHA
ncbi:MAG: glycosyltransferase [Burkholderiales bacterium]|nr:glycosyltransferase [Burkholderiales bacterium]